MIKKFKKVLAITFLIIFTTNISNLAYAANEEVNKGDSVATLSKNAIVFDMERGQVLYSKASDVKIAIPMAADIMTILLAVEKEKMDTKITVPGQIKKADNSEVLFDAGTKNRLESLLLSLVLSPTAEASNTIAQYISKDSEQFVKAMNDRAKLLGMNDTVFTAPSSYDSQGMEITLNDFSKLVRIAVNNPIIDGLLSTTAEPWTTKDSTHILINPNNLFWMGLEGIKGGMYQNIKGNGISLTTAVRSTERLVCIVSGKGDEVFKDTTTLMNYCLTKYTMSLLVAKDTVLHEIDSGGSTLPLASMEDVYYTHPVGNSFIKNLEFKVKNDIKPPITENSVVGTAKYTLGDDSVIEVNLYSKVSVNAKKNILLDLKTKLQENKDVLYLIIILCVVEVFIVTNNLIRSLKKRKSA